MGWAVGWNPEWRRDIGYGVPAQCDHPGCSAKIDRGLSYLCGGVRAIHTEIGCGLYFCEKHRSDWASEAPVCERCANGGEPFNATPDVREWVLHKLNHKSWALWRAENPSEVQRLLGMISLSGQDAEVSNG